MDGGCAWFVPTPASGPQPAAVVLHGWTGSASLMLPIARRLLAAGLHMLLLDARCHGRSEDDSFSSMRDFAIDAEYALAWLRADPRVDADRVVLVGRSVGAGACLMVAARDPRVAAVVSISSMADPAAYMGRAMRRRGVPGVAVRFVLNEIQRAIGQRFTEFAPLTTIARLRLPVLLIHDAEDPVVPLADAEALQSAAPEGTDLLGIPGAGHSAIGDFLTVAPAVTAFLHRALQSTSEVLAGSSASRTPPAASPLSPTEPALGRHVYADWGRRRSGRRGRSTATRTSRAQVTFPSGPSALVTRVMGVEAERRPNKLETRDDHG